MSALNAIRNHPLHLALALVLAFGAWVAYDVSAGLRRSNQARLDPPPVDAPSVVELQPPPFFDNTNGVAQARDGARPGVVTADLIPKLQLGMARVAVEELIGQPPAGLVHPVTMVDGKFIYRASYLANLDSGPPMSAPAPRSIIALEFDAGRPGHPLLKVHVPDPMS
jgi:hypothetical protein